MDSGQGTVHTVWTLDRVEYTLYGLWTGQSTHCMDSGQARVHTWEVAE